MPKDKKEKGATFQSYIQSNGNSVSQIKKVAGDKVEQLSVEELQSSIESHLEDSINSATSAMDTPEPTWLPGEALVTQAEQVMKYSSYSDNSNGDSGNLYVTTFRIKFVPYHEVDSNQTRNVLKNKLYGSDDVILNNVNTIYQITKGKRKRLNPGSGSQGVKLIELQCKNLRTFSFGFSKKENGKRVTDAIVHHSYPTKQSLTFAFSFAGDVVPSGNLHRTPNYQLPSDWQAELDRLNVQSYKVIDCNSQFMAAESLSGYFVVPNGTQTPDINSLAGQFEDKRIPVWCYTHSNGASLVRAAYLIPKAANPRAERTMLEPFQRAHPNQNLPEMHDIGKDFPTIKDIQSSYEKLSELCMPASRKVLENNDSSWYSNLDSCKWLGRVHICLEKSCEIVSDIVDRKRNVVIKETSGRDLSPLVSCLVQLMLDPHYRSTQGFQALIEREWVAMGHRFMERLQCTNTPDAEQSPVFLLFLDCVYQLTHQFPAAFQFSEVFLIALWDSACLGLFHNFIFNSAHDRRIAMKKRDDRPMASVWDWDKQYDREAMALFRNPLYLARTELRAPDSGVRALATLPEHEFMPAVHRVYARRLTGLYSLPPAGDAGAGVLRPEVAAPLIDFWSLCYLRWLTPVEIVGGGSAMEYLKQCMLVEEILVHQYKASCLERSVPYAKADRPASNLIFGDANRGGRSQQQPETPATDIQNKSSIFRQSLSSAFPFAPGKMSGSRSFMGSPINLILENSYVGKSEEDLSCTADDNGLYEPSEPAAAAAAGN